MTTLLVIQLIGIGVFVGIVASLFGLGGGILITPLLPLVTPMSHRGTVGTALLCIFVVVGVNSISFLRQGLIDQKKAIIYGVLASIGASLSGYLSRFVSDFYLKLFTGCLLIYIAVNLLTKAKDRKINHAIFYPMGLFAGAVSGVSGVGTGILLSPMFIKNKIVSEKMIAPTLNAILTVTCFFGALTYFLQGAEMVRFDLAGFIIFGAVVSSYWGRRFHASMSDRVRRYIMAVLVMALALTVLYPIIFKWHMILEPKG